MNKKVFGAVWSLKIGVEEVVDSSDVKFVANLLNKRVGLGSILLLVRLEDHEQDVIARYLAVIVRAFQVLQRIEKFKGSSDT